MLAQGRRSLSMIVCLAALTAMVGCEKKPVANTPPAGGGGAEPAQPAAEPATTTPKAPESSGAAYSGPTSKLDPASVTDGGSISGTVTLKGAPPKFLLGNYNMAQKPECAALHETAPALESLVVGADGGLRDVFVEISGGLEKYTFDAPKEPAVIDQKGCVYVPHVLGIQKNQDIKILNSDSTIHNVKVNEIRPMNEAFTEVGEKIKTKWFKKTGGVTFQCEVHPWMRAYARIVDHPYFSVSGADGKFTIKNLPPGEYTISVWHEELPKLQAPAAQKVVVKTGEDTAVNFEYSI